MKVGRPVVPPKQAAKNAADALMLNALYTPKQAKRDSPAEQRAQLKGARKRDAKNKAAKQAAKEATRERMRKLNARRRAKGQPAPVIGMPNDPDLMTSL